MKKLALFAFSLCSASFIFAQDNISSSSAYTEMVIVEDRPYTLPDVDQAPVFPGGEAALMHWVAQNLRYPKQAQDEAISGRVVVQFTINSDGRVVNPRVVRSKHPLLDEEALRVISEMPRWEPAKIGSDKVACLYMMPITFRLQ